MLKKEFRVTHGPLEQQLVINRDEKFGLRCENIRGEFWHAVNFSVGVEALLDPLKQYAKIAIAGQQHNGVAIGCRLVNIQRNAYVPISLGSAIAPP